MEIKNAVFVTSNTDYTKCPASDKPEYAFIGRSNVGKSSLINMLAGNSSLAKISSKPGKTQLINHFICDDTWYLVDLPGYGWAKVSKEEKGKWDVMVKDYLLYRENLYGVFVLIDVRLEPQNIDIEFINWLGQNQIPIIIVFTKADKIGKTKVDQSVSRFNKKLRETWDDLPRFFVTSATENKGKEDILKYIHEINRNSNT